MVWIARFLPLELLGVGVLLLLATGRPLLGRGDLGQRPKSFKSLRSTSWVLKALISLAVVGKPFLDYMQKHNWEPGNFPVEPLTILTLLFSVSVFAMIGGIIAFFFRAIRNINVFSAARLRSPYSALLLLIPIGNLITTPYIEYFAYQRSMALAAPKLASRWRAALLVLCSTFLLVVGMVCGRLGEDISRQTKYGPLSLLVIGLCSGAAGGIMAGRIIASIAWAQDHCARERGLLPGADTSAALDQASRKTGGLQTAGIVVLVVAALATVLFPELPTELVRMVSMAFLP
jgi:hypothetical protein